MVNAIERRLMKAKSVKAQEELMYMHVLYSTTKNKLAVSTELRSNLFESLPIHKHALNICCHDYVHVWLLLFTIAFISRNILLY